MDELTCDFGELPDDVKLWNGEPARADFRLESWRNRSGFELKYARRRLNFGKPDGSQRLKIIWMRRAKGPGFSEVRWGDKTVSFPALLLSGRYEDLDWLRTFAQKLSEILGIPLEILDMGSDY